MFNEFEMANKNGSSATMKISDWIEYSLLSLLTLIPFVGSIAYLVIYIMLICNEKTNRSLKNYMIANLIISGIVLALFIMLIIVLCKAGIFSMAMIARMKYMN